METSNILTEALVKALEEAKEEKQAHGEIKKKYGKKAVLRSLYEKKVRRYGKKGTDLLVGLSASHK